MAETTVKKEDEGEVVKLTDVFTFNIQTWIIFIICVTYYIGIFCFISVATKIFVSKFGFSATQAAAINSIVYLLSAILSPIFGFMIDMFGYHVIWVMLSCILATISHFLMATTFVNPWVSMSMLGVSYSMTACSLWPLVAYIVPKHQHGTAYGLMQSIQNLGIGVMSILSGRILDTNGYYTLQLVFVVFLTAAFAFALLLFIIDANEKSNLNISAKKRSELSSLLENQQPITKEGSFEAI